MSQVFAFQSRQVRTIAENNETWFAAVDVCHCLGISWRGNTLAVIPDAWKGMRSFRTPSSGKRGGGVQTIRFISEPAVYKLAFRSNKPEADAFTDWVASEVLPSIRKTGKYEAAPEQKALPSAGPLPEPDASKHYKNLREDLLLAEQILKQWPGGVEIRLCMSGPASHEALLKSLWACVRKTSASLNDALESLKAANRYARMLMESKTRMKESEHFIVPVAGTAH